MPENKRGEKEEPSIETEKNLKIVAKGAGLVFFGLVFSKVLTYFYRLIIARYYGPGDYGIISIGLSLITVFVTIIVLGMDAGITRFVPEYKANNDERRLRGTILTPVKISLPLAIAMSILFFLLSPYLASFFAKDVSTQVTLTTIFQIFSLTLPFSVFYTLLLAASKGFQRMDYQVYTDNIFFSIVLVCSVLLFSLIGLGINGIAWSYAITVIASFAFIFYFFNRRIFSLFTKTKTISENKIFLVYTLPLFIGSIATMIIGSFDTIFIGIFKTTSDAGIYNAALPTAKFIMVFSSAFVALFFPIIIGYQTKNKKNEALVLYRTTTKWIFFSSLPFVLLLMFFSKNALNVLFGPEYISAASVLSILSLAFFIQSVLLTAHLMLSVDNTKYVMMNLIIAAVVNVILDIILIPQYGIIGAAIATSFSSVFVGLMDLFFAWKVTAMNPFDVKAILKSIFSGIISLSLILFAYRYSGMTSSFSTLIPLFFLFLVIYSVLLFIFRAFDKNDIFILREIEKKSGIKTRIMKH